MNRLLRAFAGLLLLVALAGGFVAHAQTPTLVDPSDRSSTTAWVQSISLTINSRDWENLRIHYLENTYYPCDFKWNGADGANIGIRSRGTGSRSGASRGFASISIAIRQPDVSRVQVLHPAQPDAGSRRTCTSASSMQLFRRLGVKALARSLHEALRQQQLLKASIRSSSR